MTEEEIYNIQIDAVKFLEKEIPSDDTIAYMFILGIGKDDGFSEHFISSQGKSDQSADTLYALMKEIQRFNDTIWLAVTTFIKHDLNEHDKKELSDYVLGKSDMVNFQYRSKINYSENQ